jgi:hypothetical protein
VAIRDNEHGKRQSDNDQPNKYAVIIVVGLIWVLS